MLLGSLFARLVNTGGELFAGSSIGDGWIGGWGKSLASVEVEGHHPAAVFIQCPVTGARGTFSSALRVSLRFEGRVCFRYKCLQSCPDWETLPNPDMMMMSA